MLACIVSHQNQLADDKLTADAAFPYGDKANGAIRAEFELPKNSPYKTA